VIQEAKDLLLDIYGFELKEVGDKKANQFIVVSSIDVVSPRQDADEAKATQMLFHILSYIFMKGVDVNEGKSL
jgi:hypothetical protein